MSGFTGPDYSAVLADLWRQAQGATNTTTVAMPVANTEYNWNPPVGGRPVKKFLMKTRAPQIWRLAFDTGHVASSIDPYVTVPLPGIYWEDGLFLTAQTIYFACAIFGQTMEIIVWQ